MRNPSTDPDAGPARGRMLWAFALIGLIIALDQATKYWVLDVLKLSPPGCLQRTGPCDRIEISSVFDLSMVWNRGVSFGMMQADGWMRWALFGLSATIAAVFSVWLMRTRSSFTAFTLALVIGGAIGNLIDRGRFGAVADFLDFSGPWFGWHIGNWPVGFGYVFNVADAAISVGAVLLVLDQVIFTGKDGSPKR